MNLATIQYKTNRPREFQTPFREWINKNEHLDSVKNKISINDVDLVVMRNTGNREIHEEKMMIVEEKAHIDDPIEYKKGTPHRSDVQQRYAHGTIDMILRGVIDGYQPSPLGSYNVWRADFGGLKRRILYDSYYIVFLSGTTPEDSKKMWIQRGVHGKAHPINKRQLEDFLRFELDLIAFFPFSGGFGEFGADGAKVRDGAKARS
jgi:hypothetical protein